MQARMAELKSDAAKAGIVWEEPPPKSTAIREKKYGAALDLLMEHPKRWARIKDFTGNSSATSAAKNLTTRPLRPGKWEFKGVTRGTASRLYARYMGEGE